MINWENIGLSMTERCWRITVVSFLSLIFLILTTSLILWIKVTGTNLSKESLDCDYDTELTRDEAFEDQMALGENS